VSNNICLLQLASLLDYCAARAKPPGETILATTLTSTWIVLELLAQLLAIKHSREADQYTSTWHDQLQDQYTEPHRKSDPERQESRHSQCVCPAYTWETEGKTAEFPVKEAIAQAKAPLPLQEFLRVEQPILRKISLFRINLVLTVDERKYDNDYKKCDSQRELLHHEPLHQVLVKDASALLLKCLCFKTTQR